MAGALAWCAMAVALRGAAAEPSCIDSDLPDPDDAVSFLQHSVRMHHQESQTLLDLPGGTRSVKINIGPHYEPPLLCEADGHVACLYFDIQHDVVEWLRQKFEGNKNALPFWLGVSNYTGLTKFQVLGIEGMSGASSSLSKPSHKAWWNKDKSRSDYTPVMTLADILVAVPPDVEVEEMLTDIQGHDFMAVKSAGEQLHRVKKLTAEVWVKGNDYVGVDDNLFEDWLPYMTSMGFRLKGECTEAWVDEENGVQASNCIFVREDA